MACPPQVGFVPMYSQKLNVLLGTWAEATFMEGSYSNNKECRVEEGFLRNRLWKERGEKGYLEHVGTSQRL